MFKGFAPLGVAVIALSFAAAPASAKHHAGEKPEVHHKKGAAAPAKKAKADDKVKHAEPGDDRGGHGKDDKPGHK
jgi:hypothetical protein